MKNRTLVTTAALVAAVIALTGCSVGVTDSSPKWEPKPVKWGDCSEEDLGEYAASLRCATIQVPLDYSDPDAGMTEIAVSKASATEKSDDTEVVLLNPGGPGSSGRALPSYAAKFLPDLVADHDLVGFDPRGTGASEPLACLDEIATLTGYEDTEAKVNAALASQIEDFASCIDGNRDYIASMNATVTAHDMDSIRRAIGVDTTDYYGFSWGTYLGATYRTLYSEHIDRMVLDSVTLPNLDMTKMQDTVSEQAKENLQAYADYIATLPEGSPLGADAAAIATTLSDMSNTLAGKQVTISEEVVVTSDKLNDFVFNPRVAWEQGVPVLVEIHAALSTAIDEVEPIVDRGVEAAYLCNDAPREQTSSSVWDDLTALRKKFPDTWTSTQPAYFGFCADWPKDLSSEPATEVADTDVPLLLVLHTEELPTPSESGKVMQTAIGGTVLTVEDDIHGSSVSANRCAMAAVVAFFHEEEPETLTCELDTAPPAFEETFEE